MLQTLSRCFPLLALLAGLCWLGQGALQVGQQFGREHTYPFQQNTLGSLLGEGSTLSRLSMPNHLGAYLITGLALIAFAHRLPAYRESLKRVAIGFAFVGGLAELAGLVALLLGSFTDLAALPPIAVLMAGDGGVALSVAALLIGFGAWRAFDSPERPAARCIALFGLLTMSLAQLFSMLCYMLIYIPGIVGILSTPVWLFSIAEIFVPSFARSAIAGLLWFAAALWIAMGDKALLPPARTAPRTNAWPV